MRLPSAHLNLVGLRATAAVVVRHAGGSFEAHFDNPSQDSSFGEVDVEGTFPRLTARTVDVEDLPKDTPVEFADERGHLHQYRIEKKHEPDGLGESRVLLSL